MSAGGPIVDPRIQGFLLVPLAPYMLSSRPHLISSDRHLEIKLDSSKPANLVIDGQKTMWMGSSMTIEVRRSEHPALFVDVRRNFFEKVDKKLPEALKRSSFFWYFRVSNTISITNFSCSKVLEKPT